MLSCKREESSSQDTGGWGITGSNIDAYNVGSDNITYKDKPVFYFRSIKNVDSGFGATVKGTVPTAIMGRKIRLTGYIKSENIYGWGGMWMRVDGGQGNKPYGSTLSIDNMENRPILGSTDWTKYEIVLEVPKESRMIYYGVLLNGTGSILFSDLLIDTAGADVKTTNLEK
ncbi:MAG: hypothetical protein ABI543_01900 [Ignavibacteria bacterium]